MTQENSFHRPKLIINDKEIPHEISGNISFQSNGNVNNMTVTVESVDLQLDSLFNKKIKLFMNDGSSDSVPIFSGYIKQVTPTEKNIVLKALDVRSVLVDSTITLTDSNNYDGYTAAQFLFSYINDFINVDETIIGLDMLKDTSPPVFMTGLRGKNLKVYNVVKKLVSKSVDDDDLSTPLTHFLDVYEDGINSNITIIKDKLLTNPPSLNYSFSDGLQNYSGKKRNPANTVNYEGSYFAYGNRPTGIKNITVTSQKDSKTTRQLGVQQILLEQQQKEEISIVVTKGKDIALGSVVFLDVDDEDVSGPHRVQGKTIMFGKSSECTLLLNKKAPRLDKFLNK